jgi:hypothetical protein
MLLLLLLQPMARLKLHGHYYERRRVAGVADLTLRTRPMRLWMTTTHHH